MNMNLTLKYLKLKKLSTAHHAEICRLLCNVSLIVHRSTERTEGPRMERIES